jgi:predicted nuclease of predicted toxin-antitoxin system
MRLLFDHNLSPRLPRLLSDIHPGSIHVREAGLHESDDSSVWNYAKGHDLVLVSKDSDFQQRSLLLGPPPKFVWLRLGNCSVAQSAELLRRHTPAMLVFNEDPTQSHLMLP